jgi:hypothetical protein
MERKQIEEQIMSNSITLRKDISNISNWVNSEKFDEFIYTWNNLLEYYKHSEDRNISLSVMLEYVVWLSHMNAILCADDIDIKLREVVEELIGDLEQWHYEIVKIM